MKRNKKKSNKSSHPYGVIYEQYLTDPESAKEKPIYEILNLDPKDYPLPQSMDLKEVKLKFEKLKSIMEQKYFFLEFSEKLPVQEAYRYLAEVFLHEKETIFPIGITHLTGCGGDCPSCFQMNYCDAKKEFWTDEALEAEIARRKLHEDHS
ncbi:MAG: hypothetical protein GQ536_01560 [Candidatus Aminicenantes bacterium]|nr:hypothetical protein [Candidatus Aminicenantes bacterium]